MNEKGDIKKTSFIVDYRKVMVHLGDENFALPDLNIQESKLFVKIPKRFSISEQPNETIRLLRELYAIGKCDDGQMPEMTIISGRTYIKFDGQYEMRAKEFKDDLAFGTGKKKIIAFNKENDIYKPPDKTNVRRLEENFPGTVISLRFYLDKRYIQKEKGGRKHE